MLNDRLIAIKVDREERPDVDQIYMSAVLAMTGGGGWGRLPTSAGPIQRPSTSWHVRQGGRREVKKSSPAGQKRAKASFRAPGRRWC